MRTRLHGVDSFTGACLSCRGVFRLVWHVVNYVAAMLGCEITLLIYALAAVPLTCTGSACSQWRIQDLQKAVASSRLRMWGRSLHGVWWTGDLDSNTASTIAASVVHSKLDYCNSYTTVFLISNRLQQIQNCLARTVVKAPKSSHITPILRSLHCMAQDQ